MKLATKILIGFLVLNTLMPIMFTVMGLADPASLVGAFGIGLNSESVAVGALLPSFTLVVAAWTVLSIIWLMQGKREGLTLAVWLGVLCLIAGVLNGVVFARMGRNPLVDMPDAVRGLLILALCWWASSSQTQNLTTTARA